MKYRSRPREKNRRSGLVWQVVIAIVILSMVWFSFGQNVLSPQEQEGIPERLGTMKLVSSTEGSEALTKINQLHGTNIELSDGYIAEYLDGGEHATVWVGSAESKEAAADLIRRMSDGIQKGGAGFSNMKQLTIADGYHNHNVFQVDGPGGEHFFYQSRQAEGRVVWLTIEADDSLKIMGQAIKIF